MAYKYFTKQLLAKSNEIDLASVFPDKQQRAKENLNTNYSLPQIVEWIRDNTNNFKKQESYIIELDSAIKRLVLKYYESTNIKNPFIDGDEEEELDIKGQPRTPSEVTSQGVKTVSNIVENTQDEIQSIREAIEYLQMEADSGDAEAKEALEYLQDELKSLSK
jgi:hypothetical protein